MPQMMPYMWLVILLFSSIFLFLVNTNWVSLVMVFKHSMLSDSKKTSKPLFWI